MTTNQTISARILVLVATGMTLRQAIDAVLGGGTFERLASEVYSELRARAGWTDDNPEESSDDRV